MDKHQAVHPAARYFSQWSGASPAVRASCLFLLLALLVALPFPASAGEWSLLLNGKALHLENPAGTNYNESNWGAGVQYDFDALDGNWVPLATVSGFNDSNKNPSYYAGGGILKRFDFGPEKYQLHADVGLVAFVMVREGFRGHQPFLGALPMAALGAGRVTVNLTFIPRTEPKGVPILFFQLKIGLG